MMDKDDWILLALLVTACGLIGAERGWKGVTWNIGIGILGYLFGRAIRSRYFVK